MLVKFVFSCAFLAIAFSQSTNVEVCTANPGDPPLNIYVEGCVQPPCQLAQQRDAVINAQFKADHTLDNLRTLATAYLSVGLISLPIPFDLGENSETCASLTNAECPIAAGQVVDYQLRMFIEPFLPVGTTGVSIEFRVVDETNQPVWCARVPIVITAPSS